jgi:solute carrier family 25 phosphate transporter 23/24/25/41
MIASALELEVKSDAMATSAGASTLMMSGTANVLLSGGMAGAVSRTATAPMDRLKVAMQAGRVPASLGVRGGFRSLYREGGWRGLFNGNLVNVAKVAPESAIKFFAFEGVMRRVCGCGDVAKATTGQRMVSGAAAGALATACIYPMEVVKTAMCLAPKGTFRGAAHCATTIAKQSGARALYVGLGASLAGIVPYAALDLTIYSSLRDGLRQRNGTERLGTAELLACGTASSTTAQLCTYPLQLVRTRLQAQMLYGVQYGVQAQAGLAAGGVLPMVRSIVAADGAAGLFRGIVPNFLKAAPATAIGYAVFESCKQFLHDASSSLQGSPFAGLPGGLGGQQQQQQQQARGNQ